MSLMASRWLGAYHDIVFMRCKFGKQLFVGVLGGRDTLHKQEEEK